MLAPSLLKEMVHGWIWKQDVMYCTMHGHKIASYTYTLQCRVFNCCWNHPNPELPLLICLSMEKYQQHANSSRDTWSRGNAIRRNQCQMNEATGFDKPRPWKSKGMLKCVLSQPITIVLWDRCDIITTCSTHSQSRSTVGYTNYKLSLLSIHIYCISYF